MIIDTKTLTEINCIISFLIAVLVLPCGSRYWMAVNGEFHELHVRHGDFADFSSKLF